MLHRFQHGVSSEDSGQISGGVEYRRCSHSQSEVHNEFFSDSGTYEYCPGSHTGAHAGGTQSQGGGSGDSDVLKLVKLSPVRQGYGSSAYGANS